MAVPSYYAPSPKRVPEGLTDGHSEYQMSATIVLLCLIAFAMFYGLCLLGTVAITVLSILFLPILLSIPITFFCVLFFFFLIKGFFQKEHKEKTFRVEVLPEEHPRLWKFIEALCEEVDAPLPHRVFLSPEVNAAVFYDNDTIWGLIFPPPKNLLIGIGLVNFLNLSEFKAVLAHEFGHFSQRSMLLHRYIYSANRILGDVVFNRDWVDQTFAWMLNQPRNNFLKVLGAIGFGSLWLFRKALELYLYLINMLGAGLSREMEFHADLVAVRATGSDAIVHALSRVEFTAEALDQALSDLKTASDHDLFTDDLFYHQNHAAEFLRKKRKNPRLGIPPTLPEEEDLSPDIFDPDDESAPEMWATHPPNYDREQNAKRVYIRCPIDERSPWILFDEAEELRGRLTWRYYRVVWGLDRDVDLTPAKKVQQFIDAEQAETTYDPRYHGAYDSRPIKPGDINKRIRQVKDQPWKPEVLRKVATRLYGAELRERMDDMKALREELDKLRALDDVDDPDYDFKFRGRRYDIRDLRRVIKKAEKELDEHIDWLADLDDRVFRAHYQMASELKQALADELVQRYEFHIAAQDILIELALQRPQLELALRVLSNVEGQVEYGTFAAIRGSLIESYDTMRRCIARADRLELPKLKHVKAGTVLGYFLMEVKLVKPLKPTARSITSAWVNQFLGQLGAIEDRIRRVHFKSLGALLALQQEVLDGWLKDGVKMDRLEEVE